MASGAWRTLIGRNLQSIKLMACPNSESSAAARSFYERNFNVVKHLNPTFPFMIRPMPNQQPYLIVEYDFCNKVKIPLDGLDSDGIERKFQQAVEVGEEMPRSAGQSLATNFLPSVVE